MRTALIIFLGFAVSALGCGLDWGIPRVHFDGVDEKGHVLYVEELGKLDLGEGKVIPVIFKFSSDYQNPSSILGSGFLMPLLEANIVQLSETQFQAEMPDGWKRIFYRMDPNSNILNEGGGWKAEIEGNVITAWASCGWKLIFKRGKLTSLTTPKNQTLNIVYSDNRPSGISENGKYLLKFEYNSSNLLNSIAIGEMRFKIEMNQRPRVNVVLGKNFIGGWEPALGGVEFPDNSKYMYHFGTNNSLEPTLNIEKSLGSNSLGGRYITWKPTNKEIISDGDWTYKISFIDKENAYIKRWNASKVKEFWHYDGQKGEERTGVGNKETTKQWFVSGVASGRPRSIVTTVSGRIVREKRFSYNETGKAIRSIDLGGTITTYDDQERPLSVTRNGIAVWEIKYKKQNEKTN